MKLRAEKVGLPLPVYTWEDPYLVLTMYRSAESATKTLDPKILEALNEDERAGWTFIAGRDKVNSGELMNELAFDERKAQRVLKKLMAVKLIQRMGKGRATHYEVVRP